MTVIIGDNIIIFEIEKRFTISAAGSMRNTVVYVPMERRCPIDPSLTPFDKRKRLNRRENAANPKPDRRLPKR